MGVLNLLLQILALCAVYGIGELAVRIGDIPFPGSIAGMVILLLLLATGWVPVQWVEAAANTLLRRISLLLLPALTGLADLWPVVGANAVDLVAVVIVSTLVVLIGSAGVVIVVGRRIRHAGS